MTNQDHNIDEDGLAQEVDANRYCHAAVSSALKDPEFAESVGAKAPERHVNANASATRSTTIDPNYLTKIISLAKYNRRCPADVCAIDTISFKHILLKPDLVSWDTGPPNVNNELNVVRVHPQFY